MIKVKESISLNQARSLWHHARKGERGNKVITELAKQIEAHPFRKCLNIGYTVQATYFAGGKSHYAKNKALLRSLTHVMSTLKLIGSQHDYTWIAVSEEARKELEQEKLK